MDPMHSRRCESSCSCPESASSVTDKAVANSESMYLKELISQGWQSLMRDRMRSTLTMLGIVWGLASVVLLLAYGQGLGGCVLHAFLNMGNNVIVMWPGQTSMQAGGQRAGKKVKYELEDVEAIRDEVPIVRAVSGEIDRDFGFKIGTRVVSIQVRGVDMPYGQMRKLDLADGRYFNESDFADHRRVVILGYEAAKKVFQGAPGVGQHVEIGGLDFEVIGTMRNKIQDSMYQGPDNENGFIPFALMRDLKNIRDPDEIIIQPTAPELNKKALMAAREVIARRHHFDPKDDKATPEWDTIEDRAMINAFSLGTAGRAGTDRRLHAGGGRHWRDEHHAGFGDGAHAGNRIAQGDWSAAASHSGAVSAGSPGAHVCGRRDRDGGRRVSDLGDSAHAALR